MAVSQMESLLTKLQERQNLNIGFVPGSAVSWLVSLLEKKLKRKFLVLTDLPEKARVVLEELSTFSSANLCWFPSLDYYQPEGMEQSGERVSALGKILHHQVEILVAPMLSLFQPTIAKGLLEQYCFELKAGIELSLESLLSKLLEANYKLVDAVEEPGEVSRRGGILDLFPPSEKLPVRLEFFGDQIESLRVFDPVTQVSQKQVDQILAPPASELILTKETSEELKKNLFLLAEQLKKKQVESTSVSHTRALQEMVNYLDRQAHFYGEERFLGLISRSSLLDYLTDEWLVVIVEPWSTNLMLATTWEKTQQNWARLSAGGSLIPEPKQIFFNTEEVQEKLSRFQIVSLGGEISGKDQIENFGIALELKFGDSKKLELGFEPNPDLSFSPKLSEPISRLLTELKALKRENFSTILVCGSLSRAERIADLLREQEFFPAELKSKEEFFEPRWSLTVAVGELSSGFRYSELGLAIITEREVFGEKIRPRVMPAERVEWREEDLSDLEPGQYVVHIQYGIGIYQGMRQVKVSSLEKWDYLKERARPVSYQPCLEIEYAEGAKLYLPVDQIHQIQKYRSAGETPPKLDRLGTRSFELAKQKALSAIEKLAEDLLELYATREVLPGFALPEPDHSYREFEASFPYEETEDQAKAIAEVISDLCRDRPMDRMVLGDVGYGKTEVALRAAFLVAMAGKQTAMLCPTTILAQQHYDTFRERLKGWPLEVCMLSRFQSRSEQAKVIAQLKNGTCDIVIGTHRLLSNDIEFADLGLLIIDEEQKFGVVQKEKIKHLKKTVHCLTLSATPIPRTLEMGLLGLRDLSMINTPPPDRQAIHTELIHFDPALIREAIIRELGRRGQVFFVHNRIQGIDQIARLLKGIVPEARIAVAHGQMEERKLEQIMHNFYQGDYDVLVSTAIIESGLDLPRANTMFINRAEQFGLAQLYQLRGRIGRSKERAYAYLIIPSRASLKGDALKRLKALKEFTELGSGFRLAAYDLKIRGAGNLLGKEQSGQINRIGYELYLRLLEQKVSELKGVKIEEAFEPEVKLAIPAYFPEDYIPSDSERLSWYKRLAMAKDPHQLNSLREELLDRYGKIPESGLVLLEVVKMKFWMKSLKIPKIEADEKKALISFGEDSQIDFERLFSLVQNHPSQFRFSKDQKLIYFFPEGSDIFQALSELAEKIRVHSP